MKFQLCLIEEICSNAQNGIRVTVLELIKHI